MQTERKFIFISADCTWDYFSCTNKFGVWPDNKVCCDQRFQRCCMTVMGPVVTTARPGPSAGYGPGRIETDISNQMEEEDLQVPGCIIKNINA